MIAETIPALRSLSSDQKILLAAELWRGAVGVAEENPSPELVEALRERFDFYKQHPGETSTLEELRSRIISRKAPNP